MATVYLHIGSQKTGTSAIQQFLLMNEEKLHQEGIAFPSFSIPYDSKYRHRRNAHFLVYHSHLREEEARRREERQYYEKGFEELRALADRYPKIVLTDEAIWYRQDEKEGFWQDVTERMHKAGHELKVIVFLRRQDLFVQSLWNQSVKNLPRTTKTFDAYRDFPGIAHHNFDYYQKLCEIAQFVGKENMIVRAYEKDAIMSSPDGIFSVFTECIGCRIDDQYQRPERAVNTDLTGNFLLIKRIMNEETSYRQMPDIFSTPMARLCAGKKMPKVSYFASTKDQLAYLQRFETSNRKVAEEFLGRQDGILFREPVVEMEHWEIDRENMERDIILTMTALLTAQEQKIEALESRIRKLEKKTSGSLKEKIKRKIGKYMFWRKRHA